MWAANEGFGHVFREVDDFPWKNAGEFRNRYLLWERE